MNLQKVQKKLQALRMDNVRVMRAVAGWLLEKAEELEKKDMKEK